MRRLFFSLRVFFSSAWLSYVALFQWISPTSYVSSKIISPLTELLFFLYLGTHATGAGTAQFYLVGNSMQIAAINGIYGVTMTVGRERKIGTLIYLIGSISNRLSIFLGRAFFNILDGILGVIIGFAWSLLLGMDLSAANLPGLALTILITTASTCGLGLLLGSLSLVFMNVMFLNNTVFFLLLLFSGANLPLEKLPDWMQAISACLPLTRGIEAARLLVNGASLAEVGHLLTGEVVIGIIYAILGFVFFRWFEFQAKQHALLEGY